MLKSGDLSPRLWRTSSWGIQSWQLDGLTVSRGLTPKVSLKPGEHPCAGLAPIT